MGNVSHTPGPWADRTDIAPGVTMIEGSDSMIVAEMVANTGHDTANARLIAAAPDLLAALRTILAPDDGIIGKTGDVVDGVDEVWYFHVLAEAIEAAREAVDKAMGGGAMRCMYCGELCDGYVGVAPAHDGCSPYAKASGSEVTR